MLGGGRARRHAEDIGATSDNVTTVAEPSRGCREPVERVWRGDTYAQIATWRCERAAPAIRTSTTSAIAAGSSPDLRGRRALLPDARYAADAAAPAA